MKQVFFMEGTPIQHIGEAGRELSLTPCSIFTELEAEHLFISAGKVEAFVENSYRIQSFEESYRELKEIQEAFETSRISRSESDKYKVERRVRAYFLEADVFFSHWRRFLGVVKKRTGIDIYKAMEDEHKKDVAYNLLRIMRNYIMHAGNIIHGAHSGYADALLWADAEIIKNDIRDKADRAVLEKCDKKIDLFRLADDTYPLVLAIHDYFMRTVAEKDKDFYNLKAECEYLVNMHRRVLLFNATDWYVVNYTGVENAEIGLPYIGGVTGYGVDYVKLEWEMYKKLLEWCEADVEMS